MSEAGAEKNLQVAMTMADIWEGRSEKIAEFTAFYYDTKAILDAVP